MLGQATSWQEYRRSFKMMQNLLNEMLFFACTSRLFRLDEQRKQFKNVAARESVLLHQMTEFSTWGFVLYISRPKQLMEMRGGARGDSVVTWWIPASYSIRPGLDESCCHDLECTCSFTSDVCLLAPRTTKDHGIMQSDMLSLHCLTAAFRFRGVAVWPESIKPAAYFSKTGNIDALALSPFNGISSEGQLPTSRYD